MIKFMAAAFSIFFLVSTARAEVKNKADLFKGKYLCTSERSANKEYEVYSKCFRLNPASIQILESYDLCTNIPPQNIPNGVGKCERKDGAQAYFFNSKADCQAFVSDQEGI